jgi:hypothetical protein
MDTYVYRKPARVFSYFIYVFTPLLCISLGILGIRLRTFAASIISFILAAIFILIEIKDIKAGTITSNIRIDENGLILSNNKKRFHMAWQHVLWAGYYRNGFIIFSSKNNQYILKYILRFESMSDDLMFFQHNPEVIREIQKYWSGPIISRKTQKQKN